MTPNYYPKSPTHVPKKLTKLPFSYQLKASLAVLSILLFFILYSILICTIGYLVWYAFSYPMGSINKITVLLKAGAIAGAVMLLLFTLKFVLKLKNHTPSNRIKLDQKNHPNLWNFIHQICNETGAPNPKSIYADPDVNAYVSYNNMWLSLIFPVKKDLTIGLGLISCLNLSEFKAVMSHEFGHFAQRSMKIGSYIISANTIIHDMIFSRDKWDEALEQWRASDIRVSIAAWIITPVIWLIRQVLNLFYQFLNIMYSLLSREMEFNADKVAIHTSGSEAIIASLFKLNDGFTLWNTTIQHAYLAAQKKIYVENLYTHHTIAVRKASEAQKEIINNLPADIRGGKKYFSAAENSKVNMYASHPPNNLREDNAKTPYIHCEEDNRSPWILFDSKEAIQQKMTQLIYSQYLQKRPTDFVSEKAFEAFITAENQGKELLEEYHHTFENRYLHIPSMDRLQQETYKIAENNSYSLTVLKEELVLLMKPIKEIEELLLKARQISEGTTKENQFSFNGIRYNKKNLQEGYTLLLEQREKLFNESFIDWDTRFCAYHLLLAKQANTTDKLIQLYKQHTVLSTIYRAISRTKGFILQELQVLQSKEDILQSEISGFQLKINQLIQSLNTEIKELDHLTFTPLPNIETAQELKEAIIEKGRFREEIGPIFDNGGFSRIINALETAMVHCQRIDQKSIGKILSYHKELQISPTPN
ncbi:M48 family metallopeptidase [Aquimarina hainanensis]|uniref:M48 family metallopeptidase n=1 Tax=Aquimarina hainanensis TaxID=1578017 RepID=A0ABW5N6P3_9FLAO